MIRIQGLLKKYGDLIVLKDINLHIQRGAVYGIIGQSGAGKSTLLRCINGLETFDNGCILVDGTPISVGNDRLLREARREIGMVFQNFSLLDRLSVYDNVAFPMKSWGYNKKKIDERVKELVGLVGLTDKMDDFPSHLSGGQKQRVAIARALTMEPKVLLCDEATSALDPRTAESILGLLKEINKKTGITIIIVAHQLSVIRDICTHMAILEDGKLACHGETMETFMRAPEALRRLQGNKEDGANLSIAVQERNSSVVSHMARKLEMDFDIIDVQRVGMGEEAQMYYFIRVPEKEIDICLSWLRAEGVKCQMLEKEGIESV